MGSGSRGETNFNSSGQKKTTQRLSVTIDDNKAIMTVDAAWSSSVVNLALDREGNASSRAERVLGSQ